MELNVAYFLCSTNRPPADLGSQVPEVEGSRGSHGKLLKDVFILQRLSLWQLKQTDYYYHLTERSR